MRALSVLMLLALLGCAISGFVDGPPFVADDLGLLSGAQSNALTDTARLGVGSASQVQPFRKPAELATFETVVNTRAILSKLHFSNAEQTELNALVDQLLTSSRRVTVKDAEYAQLSIYSGVSVRRQTSAPPILEVMVAASDLQEVKARGVLAGFVKSTIWVSVARRQLRAPSGSGAAEPSYAELHADIIELYRSAFSNLLLAL